MPKRFALCLVLPLVFASAGGCGTQTEQDGDVPQGAVPAAPDVRPGTAESPAGEQAPEESMMSPEGGGATGDTATTADSVP